MSLCGKLGALGSAYMFNENTHTLSSHACNKSITFSTITSTKATSAAMQLPRGRLRPNSCGCRLLQCLALWSLPLLSLLYTMVKSSWSLAHTVLGCPAVGCIHRLVLIQMLRVACIKDEGCGVNYTGDPMQSLVAKLCSPYFPAPGHPSGDFNLRTWGNVAPEAGGTWPAEAGGTTGAKLGEASTLICIAVTLIPE